MKIYLAQHSGFCMGVRNAILKIISEINFKKRKIYVYGPLIHNPQTVKALSDRGLVTIDSIENINGKEVAIRTHGITAFENRKIKSDAARVINLTCPRVARVQAIIKKYSNLGYSTLIIGDRYHAEVTGLISYAAMGHTVISSPEEIPILDHEKKYVLVSQTTFDRNAFKEIVRKIPHNNQIEIIDTICDSTLNRQSDVSEAIQTGITKLVVIGGKNSANTTRLADIGLSAGISTFHIETEDELSDSDFSKNDHVLVTAGASTPGWIINNVLEKLYSISYMNSNIIKKTIKIVLEFAVRINLLSSVAAYLITSLNQKLLFKTDNHYLNLISFLYILSMYSVNNYFDREFLKKTNSYKYSIYKNLGKPLLLFSLISFAYSLYLSNNMPLSVTITIFISYLFGFIYSIRLISRAVSLINNNGIRKIYNARIVTTFGWAIYTVMIPVLFYGYIPDGTTAAALSVCVIIFFRQQLLDIVAFQGDLILGRETLTIWMSPAFMKKLLTAVGCFAASATTALSFIQNIHWTVLYVPLIIYYIFLLKKISTHNYVISLKYELIIDAVFPLFGLLYLIFLCYNN